MSQSLVSRSFSFIVAAVMTAGMLGGIDRLSQPQSASSNGAQWAQVVGAARLTL